jgi:uncharacterized protein involved in outer membrane biogenesis
VSRRRLSGRRFAVVVAGILAALLVLGAGAIAYLAQADLAPLASRFAGAATGRQVSIETLEIGWQDGVTIELRGAHLANAPWSETPEMAVVEAARAVIDAGALWRGVLRYERLEVRGLRLVLERGPDGIGNWEFGGGMVSATGGEAVPKDRAQFPTLLDTVLHDALITYRTSSGAILEIALDEATVRTADDDQPVAIAAVGAYNDVAARLEGIAESFDALRDAGRPYGVAFGIETKTTTATFDGTSTQPLDFDGTDGRLAVDATDTGDLAKMFRAEIGVTFPLEIAGRMTRTGDDWRLDGAEGTVAGNAFTGALRLVEAGRGQPDDVAADLDFAQFDIAPLLGGSAPDGSGYLETPLALSEAPGINLDADLRAGTFIFGKMRLADAALAGRVAGRQITVDTLAFALAGGEVSASGSSEPAASGSRVRVDAALVSIDAAEVAQLIGAAPGDVAGTIDGRATLDMTGTTVKDALNTSQGHAVVAMDEGRIARAILEMAATDLRSLFRTREGSARIHCVLGILDLENGIGRVPVLKLRTADATLDGGGTVDLVKQRVDMTFMTAPDSTGFFALDVPFRVRGSLSDPSVEPQIGGGPGPGEFAVADQDDKRPPALRQLIEGNACRR